MSMAASRNPSSATFPADPAQNPDACFGSTPPFAGLRPLSTDAVRATAREGPYLISALEPLGGRTVSDRYLFQDMSHVPPSLVRAWTMEFLNQSAQQRFWDERTGAMFGLRMRTTLRVLSVGLGDVQRGIAEWISWGASTR